MVMGALSMLLMGTTLGNVSHVMGGGTMMMIMACVYLVFAVVYFFPVYYLFKSSVGIKQGINSGSQDVLTSGFLNLKSHYKFVGIMTIILIAVYILIIAGAIVLTVMKL